MTPFLREFLQGNKTAREQACRTDNTAERVIDKNTAARDVMRLDSTREACDDDAGACDTGGGCCGGQRGCGG